MISLSSSSISQSLICIPCPQSPFIQTVCITFLPSRFLAQLSRFSLEKWFAAQSLDNQILVYSTDNFRQNRKKRFAGHTVAGYACQVGFSPDGRWISSGDGDGNVVFWDWKNGRIKSRLKAHSKVVIAHEWLPHESVSAFFRPATRSWIYLLTQGLFSQNCSRRHGMVSSRCGYVYSLLSAGCCCVV